MAELFGGYCQLNLNKEINAQVRKGEFHGHNLSIDGDPLQAVSGTPMTSSQTANLVFITAR